MISIIIVNYNSNLLLSECLKSLVKHVSHDYEILIYDNSSVDNSIKLVKDCDFENVSIIEGEENLGFAKANNIAVEHSKGSFLHFLNPDTEVDISINKLYDNLIDSNGSILVNNIKNKDDSPVKINHLIPTLKNYLYSIFNKKKKMFWYTGSSVLMSRSVFDIIGGWPEDYFMYSEDMDLFYSAYLRRVDTIFLKNFYIKHIGEGCSTNTWSAEERIFKVEVSFYKFYRKYNKMIEYFFVRAILLLYSLFKNRKRFFLEIKALKRIHLENKI